MSEKEYIVSLNKGVNYEAFNQEMIASTGGGDIPGRTVDVANARPLSQRNTHYMLTDEEAAKLSSDTRVLAVELRPDLRDDIDLVRTATQTGDFTKTTLDRGDFVNWGLRRMNTLSNPYTGPNVTGGYDYTLDGTGVDIVIQDSGVQVDHPDFYDYNGASRVQEIDWYTASGLSGTQHANHYRDYDGHGTHVAGIAAGLTYGWAKGAKIYAVKVSGLEGSGDTGTGISITDCFDVIKGWHNNKPVDPATGKKRPTIVNMSWGYGGYFTDISGGSYRGTPWAGAARRTDYGMVGSLTAFGYRYVSRVASVDVDVQELIDAGVHVVIAAGNSSQKIDVAAGLDYDNYFTKTSTGTTEYYYNRGGSPFSTQAHVVGNIDADIHSGGLEQKASTSETGPGVTVYAPGTNIMSTTSNINRWGANDGPYPSNSSFLITNISGTSMAAPNVAGALALYTQINPGATPAQGLSFINTNAGASKIYTTSLDNDYDDSRSILGGNNRFAYNKFNSATQMTIGQTTEATELVPATYALTVDTNAVNEGGSFTVTLTTTNISTGTAIPYTISGVSSADIGDEQLSGLLTISNNTATKTFTVTEDLTTEGTETFTLSLTNISESVVVTIGDTSTTPVQSYTLDLGGVASINEGSDLTVTLTTVNVPDDTTVPYTISGTGITTADIGGNALTGNFTVTSNTATLILPITSDAATEGLETMTIALDNGESSVNVNINDTSVSGAVSYTLSSSAAAVNEGDSVTITLTTTNVADATSAAYTITGVTSADIGGESLTGNFTINSNTANLVLTLANDVTTEGTETLNIALNNGQDNIDITINDTSITPAADFALAVSSTSLNEGESTTFTLTTTNVPDDTIVPYTISGVNASDLDNGPRTNAAIKPLVGAGSNFFKREVTTNYVRLVVAGAVGGQTAVPDAFVEKVARMFDLFLDEDAAGINEGKQNLILQNLIGGTTSFHPNLPTIQRIAKGAGADYTPNFLTDEGIASWGLSPLFDATVQNDMVWYLNSTGGTPGDGDQDAQEVIEHVMHTLHMHGLDALSLKLYPSLSTDWATGPLYNAMEEAYDGGFWDSSGYGGSNWKTNGDAFEVAAKEYLYLLNFCMFDYSSLWDGGSLDPEWTDDVKTPSGIQTNNPLGYALFNSYIGDVISKPSLTTIRSIFQDGDVGDPTIAGSSGYSADAPIPLTANFTVASNTATLKINIAPDVGTEGTEILQLALDNGLASQSVTINDTSLTPAATYSLSSSAASVNEGSTVTITLVTTGVSDAVNVPYTISGVTSGDISGASLTGNLTVTNGTADVVLTIAADALTEGAETLVFALDNGEATTTVTINDTSVAPSADYTITVGNNGSSDYTLSGTDRNGAVSGNDPALAFNNGDVVDFVVSASGHPFWIKTAAVTGTGSQATGVTNGGTESGTVRWIVGGTGTFYYICQYHAGMVGTINVV